jgi:hypothetical protein
VDLVQIDVVEPEALEGRVDRGEDVLSRQAPAVLAGHRLEVNLRRDDVLLAHPEELPQQSAGDDLALAAVVRVGGIEEADATLDGTPHDGLRLGLVEGPLTARVLAVAHHPQADTRDTQSAFPEVHVVHGFQRLTSRVGRSTSSPASRTRWLRR